MGEQQEQSIVSSTGKWKRVRLGDAFKTTSGGTPSRNNKQYYSGGIPWVKSGELKHNVIFETEENISEEAVKNSSAKIFPIGTLLIALYGANIGRLAKLGVEAATNQAVCGIFPNKENSLDFLYWFLYSKRSELVDSGTGGAQPNISQSILKNLLVPLPSFSEQHRIVSKIEELFSELDAGIASLKTAQQQLQTYRQSVLKHAFEGKFTGGDFRATPLADLLIDIKYGTSKKCSNEQKGLPVLRIPNITEGRIDSSDLKYAEFDANEKDQWKLREGDILIIRSNGSVSIVGTAAIVTGEDVGYLYAGYLIRLRPDTTLLHGAYLNYALQLNEVRNQIETKAKSTSGVNNINAKEIQQLTIPWVECSKQKEIVDEIENILSNTKELSTTINHQLTTAESLRQSILQRAFNGEL